MQHFDIITDPTKKMQVLKVSNNNFKRLILNNKDPNTVLQFARRKTLLSMVKSSDFFNTKTSNTTTHKYQDSELSHFSQAEQKLLAKARKIAKSICKCLRIDMT